MAEFDTITTPLLKASLIDGDDGWRGVESRAKLEKRLLWKLDKRMSILILMYILNYVSVMLVLKPIQTFH